MLVLLAALSVRLIYIDEFFLVFWYGLSVRAWLVYESDTANCNEGSYLIAVVMIWYGTVQNDRK